MYNTDIKNIENMLSEYMKILCSNVDLNLECFIKKENEIISAADGNANNSTNYIKNYLEESLLNSKPENIDINQLNNGFSKYLEDDDIRNIGIDYLNYIELNKEKILCYVRLEGFQRNIKELCVKEPTYSFLWFVLETIFKKLRSDEMTDFLNNKSNYSDHLIYCAKEFMDKLIVDYCVDKTVIAKREINRINIFDNLNKISNLNYEGESISANLLLLRKKDLENNVEFFLKLEQPVQYIEHRKIRKLLEISGDTLYLIGDHQNIFGLGIPKNFDPSKRFSSILLIHFVGRSHYSLKILQTISKTTQEPENILLETVTITFKELTTVNIKNGTPTLSENRYIKEDLIKVLELTFQDYHENQIKEIVTIIDEAKKQKHGTMVVITLPDIAEKEMSRLKNQSIKINKVNLIKNKSYLKNIIEGITSIDGAIYVDIEGNCYGIGVILDGLAVEGKGDSSRGARYNSADRYLNNENVRDKCVVVVISEDGMVDIIPNKNQFEDKSIIVKNKLINDIMTLINTGKYDESFKKIEEFEEYIGSSSSIIHAMRGLVYSKKNRFKNAIVEFTKAIELDENYVTAYNNRGNAYGKLEEYAKAIEDYTKALELDDKYATAYYNRGLAYYKLKEYVKAIKEYTKALELNKRYATAYNNRGNAYIKLEEYTKAIEDYTKALELDEKYVTAYNNRGNAYRKLEEYAKAIEDYTKALELDGKYGAAYNNRGNAYYEIKEYAKAIEDYTKALELDEKYVAAYNNRGNAYRKQEEYAKAIEDYTKALELDEKYGAAYYNRGFAYRDIEEYGKALDDYTKALELDVNLSTRYNYTDDF